MSTTYFLKGASETCPGTGADFDRVLNKVSEGAGSINFSVANGATEDSFGTTPSGDPGTDGVTGDFSTEINVTTGDNNIQASVAWRRVNSSCVTQATSAFTSEQQCSAGVKTFSAVGVSLGTWVAGDRLVVIYRFRSTKAHGGAASITIETGTTDTETVAPWSPAQTLSDVGAIASAEALGSPQLNQELDPVGAIPSAEAVQSPQLNLQVADAGDIATAEAVGQPVVAGPISGAGNVPTAEVVPSPQLNLQLADVGGVPSAEVVPGPQLNQEVIQAGDIASGQTVPSPQVNHQIADAGAIPTQEALGNPQLNQKIDGTGNIPSAEAFGIPTVSLLSAGDQTFSGAGAIPSGEMVGTPRLRLPRVAAPGSTSAFIPMVPIFNDEDEEDEEELLELLRLRR